MGERRQDLTDSLAPEPVPSDVLPALDVMMRGLPKAQTTYDVDKVQQPDLDFLGPTDAETDGTSCVAGGGGGGGWWWWGSGGEVRKTLSVLLNLRIRKR